LADDATAADSPGVTACAVSEAESEAEAIPTHTPSTTRRAGRAAACVVM
jgi:hypothetical protein